MNKDTFQTIIYKNCYIHTCQNRDTNQTEVECNVGGVELKGKSVANMKNRIRKQLAENKTKLYTREQYMNGVISHHDYYLQFVTESTKCFVLGDLTVEKIKKALDDGDEHLNKIKIPFNNMGSGGSWWWDHAPVNTKLLKEAGDSSSPSTHTCIGKACAKQLTK